MGFNAMLEVLFSDHEQIIEQTSEYLDQPAKSALSNALTLAKRITENAYGFSLEQYLCAVDAVATQEFSKHYSRYAANFDLEHEEKSLCYAIYTKAHPELTEKQATKAYDTIMLNHILQKSAQPEFNPKVFAKKHVQLWLNHIRPEEKIFLPTAFCSDSVINRFDIEILRDAPHELIELATQMLMVSAYIVCISDRINTHSKETLIHLCKQHTQILMYFSTTSTAILTQSGTMALTPNDTKSMEKSFRSASMKHAQDSRKTVSKEDREEWRDYAHKHWSNLSKPRNQVGNMVDLIMSSLESAKQFEPATIQDNIKGIKKLALKNK